MTVMRLPEPSPVFEAYWRFAAGRQDIYERRLIGASPPWSADSILASYRFTNVYRASDRVSQYLIRNVIYSGGRSCDETLFRILLFKFFNKIETWELLQNEFGSLSLNSFDACRADALLAEERGRGRRIYSNAYIIPSVPGWRSPKHAGHLRLPAELIAGGLAERVRDSAGLEDLFLQLRRAPGLGNFLAYQFAVDICYSEVVDHDEDQFIVAGPGALDGLSKVFPTMDLRRAADVIRILTDQQEYWFSHFGLKFEGLFGRRLHLIDVQNLFCEISKYSRVAFPEFAGVAGRTRIKQSFKSAGAMDTPFFPPKWGLAPPDSVRRDNAPLQAELEFV
ncbi:MAG: hypothetical protein JWM34_3298 [Ilumatobacteraceae bacterium]|nr:hypothetical protein [Ilumatobacteraceae bacterium]